MDKAKNTLLTVCAEFEVLAGSAPRHGHLKLIMSHLFDLSGIQKLYNGGAMSELDAISMVERQCKYAREEVKRALGPTKAKKKPTSVVAPMPSQFDGMTQKGGPVGEIAKLNGQADDFVKTAKLDDMLLKRIDNASGLAKEVLEYALAYKKSPEEAHKQYGTEMLHLVARKILEDLDLIKSDIKEAMREASQPKRYTESDYWADFTSGKGDRSGEPR